MQHSRAIRVAAGDLLTLSRQPRSSLAALAAMTSKRKRPRRTSNIIPWGHGTYTYQHPVSASRLYYSTAGGDSSDSNGDDSQSDDTTVKSFLEQVETSLCHDILPQVRNLSSDSNNSCTMDDNPLPPMVLLVGVSGGCDSMGLVHALLDISKPYLLDDDDNHKSTLRRFHHNNNHHEVFEMYVVHFDHCQRGVESQLDCQLVKDFCHSQNVPCHVYQWNAATSHDNETTMNDADGSKFSQEKARKWRQSTMTKLLQDLTTTATTATTTRRPGVILTAHHANDSQETLLLKLLRGVHVQNLAGMASIQQMQDGILWARPLLELDKGQIQRYLELQGYVWREDASNQSNKYLRNRVRNELVPLLQDLVGGEAVLQKRLQNLEEQCSDLRTDLSGRAEQIMEQHVDENGRFLLLSTINDDNNNMPLDLVMRQALYLWASRAASNSQFSYDVWKSVESQLEEYPDNRQWTLPLGDGWHVARKGESLQMLSKGEESRGKLIASMGEKDMPESREESVPWSTCTTKDAANSTQNTLIVKHDRLVFNEVHVSLDFVRSTVGGATGVKPNMWMFTPPWRKGRSPLKLGHFLRGQKVPLHLRDTAPIIYCQPQSTDKTERMEEAELVAVFVTDKWIIDAAWDPCDQELKPATVVILDLAN